MVRLIVFFGGGGGGVFYYAVSSTEYVTASVGSRWIEKDLRESPRGLIAVAYLHMPGGLKKTV